MNGADLLVNELRKRGVQFVSTLCGHGLNPFYAACRKAGLRRVDTRNEQAAGYLADAYGRLTRRVGVCAVSSGVAHANAMTGVVNASLDGAPMLLLTGSGALRTKGMGHFQDLDQIALAAPACKYARLIDVPDRIPQFVHDAFQAATSGRPGPVHLTFPLDVQTTPVPPQNVVASPGPAGTPSHRAPGDLALIQAAAKMLGTAKRPLLVAGSGAFYAGAESVLAEFVQAHAVPVVTPIWDRGAISEPLEEFMGVVGAATGGPRLLADADLILLLGANVDYRVGYLQHPQVRKEAQIIRIEVDADQLRKSVAGHINILGDPRSVLAQLHEECLRHGRQPREVWLQEAQKRREQFREKCREVRRRFPAGIHALHVVEAIQSILTPETVLLIDGGNIGQWAHQALCDRYPGDWLTCGASGVVGWGLPGAMAARLAYPDRPVILLSGDGALTFTIAEFETAARQGLPFITVVADDEAWGITLTEHLKEYGEGLSSRLGPIRFDQVAEGFGAYGTRVSRPDELAPALREGLSRQRPSLIHVPIVKSNPAD